MKDMDLRIEEYNEPQREKPKEIYTKIYYNWILQTKDKEKKS